MTLGRRLASTNQELDPNKQLVLRFKGSKTIIPGVTSQSNYFFAPDHIDVIQDPYNFYGPIQLNNNTGFRLNIKSGEQYTVKLSTATGGWFSDDKYFNTTLTSGAAHVNPSQSVVLESNVTANPTSPLYSTDGLYNWQFVSPGQQAVTDWTFLAQDWLPEGTPTGNTFFGVSVLLYVTSTPPSSATIETDYEVEIRRSDI